MRPLASLFVFVFLIGAIFVQAHAAGPRYTITQLRAVATATRAYTEANSINDNGVVVGNERNFDDLRFDEFRPVIWSETAVPSTLPTLSTRDANALAINNTGLIVGFSKQVGGSTVATVFGSPAYAIQGLTALDVNDAGIVIGSGGATGNFRLLTATNQFQSLGTPTNQLRWGLRTISESGRMFGNNYETSPYPGEFFLSSAPTRLYSSQDSGVVNDVNSSGVCVGWLNSRAAIFANGNFTYVVLPGTSASEAKAINDRGVIVSNASTQSVFGAYVYESGTGTKLSSLIENGSAWKYLSVSDINNRGQIIGQGSIDHDNNPLTADLVTSYRLDPIRSPGDTNYDNLVNYADVLTLVQNYNRSGNGNVFYETGDFNYDWVINAADRLTMSQNYYNPALFESDWNRAVATIPEPVSLAMLSLPLLIRRRRQ